MLAAILWTLSAAEVDSPLLRATYAEDLAAVEKLLRQGADAKTANRYGATALATAAANGHAGIITRLLAAGASANERAPGGETVLMIAARTGRLEAVKALLERGADVNATEPTRGQTALMWAAAEGHAGVVEALVRADAHVTTRLATGYTALLFAVREGRLAAVEALLKAGANVNDTIDAAPTAGKIRGGAGARNGTAALLLAVINGHFDLAARLLERGADPNANASGWTALHAITQVRKPGLGDNNPAPIGSGRMTSLDMIKKLKDHGADLNARLTKRIAVGMTSLNTTGATAFLLAARSGDAEMMRYLHSLGADPLIPNSDGSTPLIAAAGLGTRSPGEDAGTEPEVMEAVEVALALGNDINAVDKNGETAMHGAAYKNLPGVVRLLALRGAKRDVWDRPNKQGWTPLRIAEGYRFGNFKPSPVTVEAFQDVMGR